MFAKTKVLGYLTQNLTDFECCCTAENIFPRQVVQNCLKILSRVLTLPFAKKIHEKRVINVLLYFGIIFFPS